jgi:hypothetical protein
MHLQPAANTRGLVGWNVGSDGDPVLPLDLDAGRSRASSCRSALLFVQVEGEGREEDGEPG